MSEAVYKDFLVIAKTKKGEMALIADLEEKNNKTHNKILNRELLGKKPFTIRISFTKFSKLVCKKKKGRAIYSAFTVEAIENMIFKSLRKKGAKESDVFIEVRENE